MGKHSIGHRKKGKRVRSRAGKWRGESRRRRLAPVCDALAAILISLAAYAFLRLGEALGAISVKPEGLAAMTAMPGAAYLAFAWRFRRVLKRSGTGPNGESSSRSRVSQDGIGSAREGVGALTSRGSEDEVARRLAGERPEAVPERIGVGGNGLSHVARDVESETAVQRAMEEFIADAPILTSESETVEIDVPLTGENDESGKAVEAEKRDPGARAPKIGFSIGALFKKRPKRPERKLGELASRARVKAFRSDGALSTKLASGSNGSGSLPKPTSGPVPGSIVRPSSYADEYAVYKNLSAKGGEEGEVAAKQTL